MSYSPVSNTKNVEESDRWIGVIPPLGAGNSGKFFVFVKDNQNQSQFYPRKKAIEIQSQQILLMILSSMNLWLIMESQLLIQMDEYDDWIELYNPTSNPIPL
jgi:hypothetical protein